MPLSMMVHCLSCMGTLFEEVPREDRPAAPHKYRCLGCNKVCSASYLGKRWFRISPKCINCHHDLDEHIAGGECMIFIENELGSTQACPCVEFEE